VASRNRAFFLRGKWQVGLFYYVISNKLVCFVTWSVISWPVFYVVNNKLTSFVMWSVISWPLVSWSGEIWLVCYVISGKLACFLHGHWEFGQYSNSFPENIRTFPDLATNVASCHCSGV
jgi:hypothetical protein